MKGAQALIRTLADSGVRTCFTNPGTSEMHFVAARDSVPEMRAVLALFEGVATGAADGYARMAGGPAATLLHLGPGLGNGLAFVPLTTTALHGVAPADAGAASGLVNVMQQVGGSLGLAVLVTVFGSASKDAVRHLDPALSPAEAAKHVFVTGAGTAIWTATALLAATWLLVTFAIRPAKPEPIVLVPDDAAELDAAAV